MRTTCNMSCICDVEVLVSLESSCESRSAINLCIERENTQNGILSSHLSSHLIESYLMVELYVLLPRVGLVLVSDVLVVHVDASYHRSIINGL